MSAPNAHRSISYPPELPVSQLREEISRAISENQVVIVAGETGSGKTTQLPKICLELGRESIGHTQPRRIAARTIAERIAEELGSELGELVGYQVRFTDRVSASTRIKLMTDGILLNELHRDRLLKRYDTIIIDEAHERSLNVDFLLGYLKQLLPKRPDLKVIITSATIDPESFAKHFADANGNPAPIIEVSGRTFPVEIRYRPVAGGGAEVDGAAGVATAPTADEDMIDAANTAIDELALESPGDILIFFSGENEIRDAADAIEGRKLKSTEVLPLYGRLSAAEQHRVFAPRPPGTARRIVLATNVAETSLTVPGIKYVIDTGTARISRFSARSKIQQLPIEAISKASANQRSGRAGRTSAGIAIRVYSEEDFQARAEFTDPEILRTNLASVILQMLSLGLGDLASFPFLQPPDSRGVRAGQELLRELGAISSDGTITKLGRKLASLPVDPRYGRIIIESARQGVVREVLAIVAALSIQDPRERPTEKRAQADQLHARFTDKSSDFIGFLNLWRYLKDQEKALSGNAFRKLCRREFLNYLRVREWGDIYRQLRRSAKQLGIQVNESTNSTDADAIHRSILAGLLSQLGIRDEKKDAAARSRGDYLGSRNTRFAIFPGSALAKKKPVEIMSAELVETSRLFARTNAAIDLSWAEALAGDQAKRTYSEPHWEKKQGSAVIFERVTLFGLPIVERRRIQLSRIDPALARELFIRSALVEGEIDTHERDRPNRAFEFLRLNAKLRAELEELEERSRRRGFLADDQVVFDFYDSKLPAEVTDQRAFERWWKDARATEPNLLTLRREDLLEPEAVSDENAGANNDYPSTWTQADQTLSLSYRFVPGAEDDGVTVEIPLALLPRITADGFDWQVPGLRLELVTALLRSLPKQIRRHVVPVNDWAKRLLGEAVAGADGETPALGGVPATGEVPERLVDFLASQIRKLTFTPVDPTDFDLERVPNHLKVSFAAVNTKGHRIAISKSLTELQTSLKKKTGDSVAAAASVLPNAIEREGLTNWDFDDLPEFLDVRQGKNTIRAYPSLVDNSKSVAIKLLSTPSEQAINHRAGTVRLLSLSIASPISYIREHLTDAEKLSLARGPYRSVAALFEDCFLACASATLGNRVIRNRSEFEQVRSEFSASVMDRMFDTVALVSKSLSEARTVERQIEAASNIALIAPLADERSHLDSLIFDGFVSATGLEHLRRLPVYLQGANYRITKLQEDPGRDRVRQTEIETATVLFLEAGGQLPLARDADPELARARWLLEEFRLSLFAQHLGTAEPVSLPRIRKLLQR